LSRDHVLARLKPWLEDASKPKLGQHLKYDSHIFANYGVRLAGVKHDTLLESYVLRIASSARHGQPGARHLERKTITYAEVCGKGASQIGFDEVAIERATEYAAEDADITLALHHAMWPQIEHDDKLRFIYEKIECPPRWCCRRSSATAC
jgi:DNA polymerase-1